MEKSESISNRMDWLKAMLTDEVATVDVSAEQLKTAKLFCALEVAGRFDAISYNTLKTYLQKSPIDIFGVHAYPNNFEYFLDLRRQVYEDLVEINYGSMTESSEDVDWKRMYRNALWQSNLCATAYLSLRRELQGVLQSNREDLKLDYRKLEKVLNRSASTYLKIVSQEPESLVPDLKVIPGKKK